MGKLTISMAIFNSYVKLPSRYSEFTHPRLAHHGAGIFTVPTKLVDEFKVSM